ncbi:HNH endonuclease signature motif containing protein [Cellulosilyticum sp. I15G10I2]|uniref:HNH endonuclease signature motif containing protein n=1 Tax=Cellulosilyticum sp. I15G10I2 TaxID=1892843 RepID=UPI00085CA1AC|nr:HNH endonuclease signature motif containing protein [Cellulosilyticum sp. I15G10I2]
MEKQLYLFDPKTGERKKTTYKILSGITGRSISSLRSSKRLCCKMKILGCYIVDADTPISVYRGLLAKEVIKDEVWRDIPNADRGWQVSSYGRYRSKVQDRWIYRVPYMGVKDTSTTIGMRINGVPYIFRGHEWVIKLFLGDPPKGHVSYHKDGNKANNRVENLGFITRYELMQKQALPVIRKPVAQLDEVTGEVLAEYKSLIQAAQANYTTPWSIRQALKEDRPAIGFIWTTEDALLEKEIDY